MEASLGNEGNKVTDSIQDEGIRIEKSAPATPWQNGMSERSWEKGKWTCPIETLNTWMRENNYGNRLPHIQDRPSLTNLYAYGFKAYPLKTEVLRGQNAVELKKAPRAHIGYFVGHEGSSIYRIWVPKKGKVIRTANLTFQEKEFYNSDDEPAVSAEVAGFIVLNGLSLEGSPAETTQVSQTLNVPEPAKKQAPEPQEAQEQDPVNGGSNYDSL